MLPGEERPFLAGAEEGQTCTARACLFTTLPPSTPVLKKELNLSSLGRKMGPN